MDDILAAQLGVIPEPVLRQFSTQMDGVISKRGDLRDPERNVKSIELALQALVHTADSAFISPAHRASATNAICALYDRCQPSKDCVVQALVQSNDLWQQCFAVFLNHTATAIAKAMRQLLVTLTSNLLKTSSRGYAEAVKKDAVVLMLDVLLDEHDHLRAKPSLQALTHLLSKDIVLAADLVDTYRQKCHLTSHDTAARAAPALLRATLPWFSHRDTSNAAGQFLVTVFRKLSHDVVSHEAVFPDSNGFPHQPLWADPLIDHVIEFPDSLQSLRSHLFPELFRSFPQNYTVFLEYLDVHEVLGVQTKHTISGARNDAPAELVFMVLQAGKDAGILREQDEPHKSIQQHGGYISIPDHILGRLLAYDSSQVRLASLHLLISSISPNRPFSRTTLDFMRQNLGHLLADSDSYFRGEVQSFLQQLLDRIRCATAFLSKEIATQSPETYSSNGTAPQDGTGPVSSTAIGRDLLQVHKSFLGWFTKLLTSELRPAAPYQKHIAALLALIKVVRSGLDASVPLSHRSRQIHDEIKWSFQLRILTRSLRRNLHDLLMDPFDDVRQAAAAVLAMASLKDDDGPTVLDQRKDHDAVSLSATTADDSQQGSSTIPSYVLRAEQVTLLSGRADHADGVARTYALMYAQCSKHTSQIGFWCDSRVGILEHLISQLEQAIALATTDMSAAVTQRPMHGICLSLRYILDRPDFYTWSSTDSVTWQRSIWPLIPLFGALWNCVKDVLCNDAPEGHVPDDMEAEADLSTKDILSYSWRALKESSLLLRSIVLHAPIGQEADGGVLNDRLLKLLGDLCFTQLVELRHRGAFSTVAQTFASCCIRCQRAPDPNIQQYLDTWYHHTMFSIKNKGSVITRRSGGLPSLIVAILAADPAGPLFGRVMEDLQAEAQSQTVNTTIEESSLPQVHALNSLRTIFISTKLAASADRYITSCLKLAAQQLRSQIWSIRNCGLMLFRALIDRLLGNTDPRSWSTQQAIQASKFSYERYPSLPDILLDLLQPTSDEESNRATPLVSGEAREAVASEAMFPALLILQKAPVPRAHRAAIVRRVEQLTAHPHWHLRDMAARSLCCIYKPMESVRAIARLFAGVGSSQNGLHGVLLVVRYLQQQLAESGVTSSTFEVQLGLWDVLRQSRSICFSRNPCPFTQAAFVDAICFFAESIVHAQHSTPMEIRHGDHTTLPLPVTTAMLSEYYGEFGTRLSHLCVRSYTNPSHGPSQTDVWPTAEHFKHFSMASAPLRTALGKYYVLERRLRGWPGAELAFSTDFMRQRLLWVVESDVDSFCSLARWMLSLLATLSPDARQTYGEAFLEAVAPLAKRESRFIELLKGGFSEGKAKVSDDDNELTAVIQNLAASALDHRSNIALVSESTLDMVRVINGGLLCHIGAAGSPSVEQSSLQLSCLLLDAQLQYTSDIASGNIEAIDRLSRQLASALDEQNDFSLRFAAAEALRSLRHLFRIATDIQSSALVRLGLVVYDALNDDDEEIRDLSTQACSRVILGERYRSNVKDLFPLAASQKVAEHLSQRYATSRTLCHEAVKRMIEQRTNSDAVSFVSVSSLLMKARDGEGVLFAEERQNLFIDDVRETAVWSRVLKSLSPRAITRELATALSQWVVEGLIVLTETARTRPDGPLGSTSKPDVFTLGIRVIYAAEVLLDWRMKTRKAPVTGAQLRRSLRELADVGEANDLHPMWLERIEDVLEDSIVQRLRHLSTVLSSIGLTSA